MTFDEILSRIIALLRQEQRVSYRALKLRFHLDDEYLEAVREEMIYAKQLARDEEGRVLVWTGGAEVSAQPACPPSQTEAQPVSAAKYPVPVEGLSPDPSPPEAERRQLTVLFCDLVDSTKLASQLDPEELRALLQAYHTTCTAVIQRFDGHIAQYLGDGVLVYFGYPHAHEDDAQRAVRTGLGIVEALSQLATPFPLPVRIGIHTGSVVVGAVGSGVKREQLALGETPNIAARLQGIAMPDRVVISAATHRLIEGFFACEPLGTQVLKGIAQPVDVYHVVRESAARSRLEVIGTTRLTPLVGREQEVGLLLERWEQVREGHGQLVTVSGEAGIGKSRLVQVLKEHVADDPQAWLTPCQCSPYHQHSALYPFIELLQRVVLQFAPEESPTHKLHKLEGWLVQYGLPLPQMVPLFATLLSLPLGEAYAPLPLSPEQQRRQTLQALLTILLQRAAQQPLLLVVEDLHWVDPSTLELLGLLVDQGPTARILTLLTYRPGFVFPWPGRAHLTPITLQRLTRPQTTLMVKRLTRGKTLPPAVLDQIVTKTDGVPLFVEELTKMVLESGLVREDGAQYVLTGPLPPLAIPTTLHDSLMARLDRLAAVKGIAQLGATIGRQFSYTLLQTVSPLEETALQHALAQLVEAELLYQQGFLPQANYRFKHALIQEVAYQSLLKSTRQQYHQQIAQALEARFPETVETQPELVAHHYTEAGLNAQALPYWQQAGQQAIERSAHREAIAHLARGLAVLQTLPDTPERIQQELTLQITLGVPLIATKGYGSLEVKEAFTRAWKLCQHLEESPQLFLVLRGLWNWHLLKGELGRSCEFGERLFALAQRLQDPALLVEAHRVMGTTLFFRGELLPAQNYLEPGITLYDRQQHRALAFLYGADPGVVCQLYTAWTLWLIGYPDQARHTIYEALNQAQELSQPFSLAFALSIAATVHYLRREHQRGLELAEANIVLSTEHSIAQWLAHGVVDRGGALVEQGKTAEGIAQIQEGLDAWQSTGANLVVPHHLSRLAETYGKAGRTGEGLGSLTGALALVEETGERFWEAELYRLKGELLLQQSAAVGELHAAPIAGRACPAPAEEAETCFRQALDIARRQQAKSLELRAVMSLSRLWQQQGKRAEARELLAPIYGWFTEGFETRDLQEARALLAELT
ncbi:MAG: adenylate cyclase [Nitrospinota bacterium]|nr:MAG: adenylate cyclase [Nitrospinota bacterium]